MLRTTLNAISRPVFGARAFSAAPAKLPDLPYDYSALAPAVAPEIMQVSRYYWQLADAMTGSEIGYGGNEYCMFGCLICELYLRVCTCLDAHNTPV